LLLASATSAMGQAAVDQYLPSAKPGGHHGGARAAVREARADAASTTAEARQAKAKAKKTKLAAALPGSPGGPTDSDGGAYPLTTFIIIVILLFLLGLTARYLPRLIRRLQSRPAS
jgi:hypothetical protein